jgi:hypothetical protein
MADRGDLESSRSPGGTALVAWDDLRDSADLAFAIWVDQPELRWARQAWSSLERAGLTSYVNERQRHRVLVRFVALADLYHEFCHLAWDEMYEPGYLEWADELNFSRFRIGQLAGLAGVDEWPDDDEAVDDDEVATTALVSLVHSARAEIVPALRAGFGGVEGLFVALWRSNRFEPEAASDAADTGLEAGREGAEEEDYDDDEEEIVDEPETDEEILNNVTGEKLRAYEWLAAGCPP